MAEERTFGAGLLHDKIDPRTGLPTVGLFQDPDGSSWVREPDYTETRLPAGGGGGGGPPTGAAGGALAGTYPNPDLAAALAGAGLSFLANVVSVNVDGATVEVVGDVVRVKDGGITPVKLSFDPATQAELDALAAVVAALDAVTVKDGDAAGGDLAGTYPNPTLVAIGAATGPIGDGATVPVVTIDAKGRVTALTSAAISSGAPSGPAGGVLGGTYPNPGFAVDMATQAELDALNTVAVKDGDAAGGVLSGTYPNPGFAADMATQAELDTLAASAVLDGDTANGDLSGTYPNPTLDAIVAAAGPLGSATTTPVVTIDAKGRVTALSSATITGTPPGGAAGGVLSGTYPDPGFASDMATQAELNAAIDSIMPRVRTGQNWYYVQNGPLTTGAAGAGALEASKIWLPGGITLNRIGVEVTAFIATGQVRLGIYADSGFDYPGALLLDAGQVATSGSNGVKDITISYPVPSSAWYWIVSVNQTAAATERRIGFSSQGPMWQGTWFATAPGNNVPCAFFITGINGALPNPFGAPPFSISNVVTRVHVRVA